MRRSKLHISLLLLLALSVLACGRTPGGVISTSKMADLIVDLQLAEAYIESHGAEFGNDSTKLVLKQSIFKKHGITQQEYDSSLVWYAHNMEEYNRAYDKAVKKLKNRYDKLDVTGNEGPSEMIAEGVPQGAPTHNPVPRNARPEGPHAKKFNTDAKADTFDMWQVETMCSPRGLVTVSSPLTCHPMPVSSAATDTSLLTALPVAATSSRCALRWIIPMVPPPRLHAAPTATVG